MARNGLAWQDGVSRFWHVAFRLGLVRFDWASLGKAVELRRGEFLHGLASYGKSRQGGSGKAGHGKAR